VLVSAELLFGSRIQDIAHRAGVTLIRVDSPDQLTTIEDVSLVLVDWDTREASWIPALRAWLASLGTERRPRVILYGSHADLGGHAAAKTSGLGPVVARSKLLASGRSIFDAAREG
jgi:hypothetical protein